MPTLYEIDKNIMNCIKLDSGETVNAETGELMTADALDNLKMERSEKIKNIALAIKNFNAEGKACEDEADTFNKRAKAAYRKADWLLGYLRNSLNGEVVKDTQFVTIWRKSQAVNITDEKAIPSKYLVQKPPTVSKAEIKKAIKAGKEVPGAELVDKLNLSIK